MPNRLRFEKSPYLLQHQDNPVDWYPWGEEAFTRARAEGKPIFLSVGYSTCHWCHVMEHESFENADVAEALNRDFIAVKVDREERPDVDRVYMTFVQATTGSGGWPMSVWLTPHLAPFYGGTYFPPESRWGRPGFIDVLREIARAWREERDKVMQSSAAILGRLRAFGQTEPSSEVPGPGVLDRSVAEFEKAFDARHGGFGTAPKFPRPSELLFLFREHARTGRPEPRDMALQTLRAMALGGMRDHLGGGFHRYSVDAAWRVPHFEKMLYDQAQLVLAFLEASQASGDAYYAEIAAETLAYVRRDLTDPDGGFYSAEDADSVPPALAATPHPQTIEGAFYVWEAREIKDVLGEEAALFIQRFGIKPEGNAPADPQGEFRGQNLLYTARSLEELAREGDTTPQEVERRLAEARRRLFEHRLRRPRPHRDDKILTAWNGLMVAAFARGGRVLPEGDGYIESARRAADFLRRRLWDAGARRLFRRYRHGDAAVEGYAEDYACLIFGLIELFQADGDSAWLEWAATLQARQDELFQDAAGGGWFSTTGDDASVLLRLKEDYDGAEPSASAIGLMNLMALAHLTGGASIPAIELTLRMFASRAAQSGRTVPMALAALSTYHAGMPQIVLAAPQSEAIEPFAAAIRKRYLPTALTIRLTDGNREALARQLSWVSALQPKDGHATAYVCREFTCLQPTTDPEALASQLDALSETAR